MNKNYIITNEELAEKGLDLNDYALDGTCINAVIMQALDIVVIPRVLFNDDSLKSEKDIELYLDNNPDRVYAFKKLQYLAIYYMIFQAETSPVDVYLDTIIVFELRCGKINGFQKGLYYKHD